MCKETNEKIDKIIEMLKTVNTNDNSKNSDKIIFEEIKEKNEDQFDSIKTIDNKTGIIIALVGVLTIGLLNSNLLEINFYFTLSIIALFSLSILFAFLCFIVKSYHRDPDPSNLIEEYKDKLESVTRGQLIRNYACCYCKNVNSIRSKKYLLNISIIIVSISIVFILTLLLIVKF